MQALFKKSTFLGVLFFLVSQVIIAQINPIIDLVNTPNNDIDGQVVVCANVGSQLPHIFLCGANDVANLAVGFVKYTQCLHSGCLTFVVFVGAYIMQYPSLVTMDQEQVHQRHQPLAAE